HGKVFALESLVGSHEVRIFFAAGYAPTRPKIDKHIFSPEIGQGNRVVVWVILRKIGGLLAYGCGPFQGQVLCNVPCRNIVLRPSGQSAEKRITFFKRDIPKLLMDGNGTDG